MLFADFHTHTTASDGTTSPADLVYQAKEIGLTYLAITDHDTTAGVPTAQEAAARVGIRLLPGVELSAEGSPGKAHLLGLGIDPTDALLNKTLAEISEKRRERNIKIADRLQKMGIPITLEAVTEAAPVGANVGRPHFAQWLLTHGHVSSLQEAFRIYLGDGAKAFFDRDTLTPQECINLIHGAGGVCLLAHPCIVRLAEQEKIEQRIAALKEIGMDGLEVYYSQHTHADTQEYRRLAEKYDLLITGGSDFHGDNKKEVTLGKIYNDRPLPASRLSPRLLEMAS